MHRPDRILDSHIHLVTGGTFRARLREMSALGEELKHAYRARWEKSLKERNEPGPEQEPPEVDAVAVRWEEELERAGIERAVFFTGSDDHREITRFAALNPGRFIGYATFNPAEAANAQVLQSLIREQGIRGLKLYPMARHFHVNDPACFPVYAVCQEHRLPVVIHFGLSINATHDLSYGSVLDLAAPALRFPGVQWIIPHFGAGFFGETLLLAAQYANIFIDTSSSNNWVRYAPVPLSLMDLFRRTYEALGSKRILFGSDSSFFPRGYRTNILEQQLSLWNRLGVPESEINDIFYGNIARILGL